MASGLRRIERVLPEAFEHMVDESGGVARAELLIVFKDGECRRPLAPRPAYSSAIATLGLLIGWAWGKENNSSSENLSCFANYTTCPALLAPRHFFRELLRLRFHALLQRFFIGVALR